MDTDAALAARLARDVEAAFPSLVAEHQDRLYTIALRLLGDRRDAEEVAQDALVRAFRAMRGYPRERIAAPAPPAMAGLDRGQPRPQPAAPARRSPAARTSSSRCSTRASTRRPTAEPARRRRPIGARRSASWPRRCCALTPAVRAAIVLRHVDGLSVAETAEALGRPEGTIKAQVHRGLRELRVAPRGRARRAVHHPDPHAGRAPRAGPGGHPMTTATLTDDHAGALAPRPPSRRPAVRRVRGARRGRARGPLRPDRHAARPGVRRLERARRLVGRHGRRRRGVRSGRFGEEVGRPIEPRRCAARAARERDSTPPRRRPPGAHPARPARPHPVRGHGLDEGAGDPAWRGPAVRLDRRGDRPPEGGPRGRHGARPQPRAARRALPPRGPQRRHDRPVLDGRPGGEAAGARRRGPRHPRPRGRGGRRASASPARTRRTSCATRPAATRAG